MAQRYVGQIMLFGGNFAPVGFLPCNGQLVSISDYEVLYNLIGTTYGGDGQTTFGLPDLRGRASISQGSRGGIGYTLGQPGGQETVTLTAAQLPQHHHLAQTTNAPATANTSSAATIFADQSGSTAVKTYGPSSAGAPVALSPASIKPQGGSQAHDNRQPYLALTHCITVYGVYPPPN